MSVDEYQSTFRNERFHDGPGRARTVPLREKMINVRQHRLILNQPFAKQAGDEFTGEIIGGRPQSTGGDDQAGTTQGFADRALNLIPGIGHRHLPGNDVAQISQTAAKPLLMRVQDKSQHEFAAGVNKFDVHAGSFRRGPDAGKPPVQVFGGAFGLGLRASALKVPIR